MAHARSIGSKGAGWHKESVRHRNAKLYGKAGGRYASNAALTRLSKDPKTKNLSYINLRKKGIYLIPNKDFDKDGTSNIKDCQPLNKKEQGLIHDFVAGVGRLGGYVVAEVGSGIKDIPQSFNRQRQLTLAKENEKETKKDFELLKKIEQLQKKREQQQEELQLESNTVLEKELKLKELNKSNKQLQQLIVELQKGKLKIELPKKTK